MQNVPFLELQRILDEISLAQDVKRRREGNMVRWTGVDFADRCGFKFVSPLFSIKT